MTSSGTYEGGKFLSNLALASDSPEKGKKIVIWADKKFVKTKSFVVNRADKVFSCQFELLEIVTCAGPWKINESIQSNPHDLYIHIHIYIISYI